MMKVSHYIKHKGMLTILSECNYNLQNVRQHLRRECELPDGYDLSRSLKSFEDYLRNKPVEALKQTLLQEITIRSPDSMPCISRASVRTTKALPRLC